MRFFYVNTGNTYPPNKHLIDGLRANGHDIFEMNEAGHDLGKYVRIAKNYWQHRNAYDAIIVGYPNPVFVPLMRILSLKPLIFNAVASQYEANIISRESGKLLALQALKWWLVDAISFHMASRVLLESNAQIDFIHKLFFVPRKKLVRSWTGVDEEIFFYDPSIPKREAFTVLFRGKFLPESGVLTVIEAAKKLEGSGVQFLIIGNGFMYREVNALTNKLESTNIEMIGKKLDPKELREQMLSCHISLGQLANHSRLSRTLPCKLFESLALRLPYLTGRNAGALELLVENETCFAVDPGNADDLARKIIALKEDLEVLARVAAQGHAFSQKHLTSRTLAHDVFNACFA